MSSANNSDTQRWNGIIKPYSQKDVESMFQPSRDYKVRGTPATPICRPQNLALKTWVIPLPTPARSGRPVF
ncbi:MAG: hypothetical protein QOH31_3017 [Verrucomicrobiota bacterium]|jgi:hypothetical protein